MGEFAPPHQFVNCNILTDVREALEISGLDPRSLVLEITEGIFLSNLAETDEVLAKLTAMGVSLAMDDFGKGYSSLSYLRKHPFSIVKIDKVFIRGMERSPQDCSLVQASIGMARALQLKVVAEGVETPEQLATLTEFGVDYIQGYLMARPMSVADYQQFMQ
jgi:EAL domain-containing protein (putative c-di-GMP-specific phosphodiesterase class I)